MSLRYDLTYDIVTTSPSLLMCIILKPRPLIASQFEQFQHTNFENIPKNYDSEQFEDAYFRSGVIVSFFFFFFTKNGAFGLNMVRIKRIHCCVLICLKKYIKIRLFQDLKQKQTLKK